MKQAGFGACSVDGSSIHKLEISVARAMCSRRICGNANRLEDMRRDRKWHGGGPEGSGIPPGVVLLDLSMPKNDGPS